MDLAATMSKDETSALDRRKLLSLTLEVSDRIVSQQQVGQPVLESQAEAIGKVAHFLLDHGLDWPTQLDRALRYVLRSTPAGRARSLVVLAYVKSERFQMESSTKYTAEFVREAYQVLLGREADDGGMIHWSAQINTGRVSKAQVIGAILASEEFRISHNLPEWCSS